MRNLTPVTFSSFYWPQVPVSGVSNVVAVETSDEAAYVLTAAGRVFRRCGVTSDDYVGTAWREVPAGAGTQFNSCNLCQSFTT